MSSKEMIEAPYQVVIRGFIMKEHAEAMADYLRRGSNMPKSITVVVQRIKERKNG